MARDKLRQFASIRPLARFSEISLRDFAVTAGPLILITAAAIVRDRHSNGPGTA